MTLHILTHAHHPCCSQVLPGSAADTEQRLAAVREELGGLEARQAAIGRRASRRQLAFVWGGLGSQAALWALLFRLTFYELSWVSKNIKGSLASRVLSTCGSWHEP